MKLLSPTQHKRLNEVAGLLLLSLALLTLLSLVSYHAQDPSLNTAAGAARPLNLIGYPGSYAADLLLQAFGLAAFLFPVLNLLLAWKWIRSEDVEAPVAKILGTVLLLASVSAVCSVPRGWAVFGGTIHLGGMAGRLLGDYLLNTMNIAGAMVLTATTLIVSVYLVSSFTMAKLAAWFAGPIALCRRIGARWAAWKEARRRRAQERRKERQALAKARAAEKRAKTRPEPELHTLPETPVAPSMDLEDDDRPPFDILEPETLPELSGIPICQLETSEAPAADPFPVPAVATAPAPAPPSPVFKLPPTSLLNEPPPRNTYDEQELQDIAARVKAKFEEFHVLGSVVQINPGPVVTTFEFKPEAGIKYSRITPLREDLCLGLQAESILIERIPGKPTVGIEVPNSKRELIALRQVLESDEFTGSASHLTMPLGKDINGRMKVSALDAMPHLLIAGSTGSGKSVMINSMIMSILYKSTPDEVRLIMVDPKRLELGLYEGIPHLLTPVITDPKKATNALRNAVLEMERRLRLLAEQGVRNIDQYNRKIRKLMEVPGKLFEDDDVTAAPEDLQPLPYIMILIDELADLMMLEGRNVEESVTRLAQMARAVGMHLVLATQRPSVDVITGLIKANFPARISFRVATRVDSRTILDVMGAEHLLGKGDMLFLPPGSSRLVRVHGAFVTESEINRVVEFWKAQAQPEYDQSFLAAPPAEDGEAPEEAPSGEQDPMYEDAVRVILEAGKASTSILQRRLRLGYGRAARILDMMQRDGLIGPPDGSKPREVLKRPDWLHEVEDSIR
ncbi:MAG TPA: DNA translocase FtsK 4TM domain-containing protein [Bryobacteraceae bacterium]|nr:DNA translocase FtsK 4TM domain-containing protein [Bryobacteraceae bacterium]